MYMHVVFSPSVDDFLRRASQKWDECLSLIWFGEGETLSGQIFLLPPHSVYSSLVLPLSGVR